MLTINLVAIPLFAASAFGEIAGFSTVDRSFGGMIKRQGGYYPTTHYCGTGDTCAEACGAGQETCPSSSGLYCFDPTAGDTCCPDGTGNSCSVGYYCTSDPEGTTYCCPNGVSLSECGAAYSLTVALVSETGSVVIPPSTGSASASTTPAAYTSSSLIHVSVPPAPSPSVFVTGTGAMTPISNGTYSATASAPLQVTTNAAEKVTYGGIVVGFAFGLVGAVVGL